MNVSKKTADKVAARYSDRQIEDALGSLRRRRGGLFGILTEDARRELLLTLGDNHRATQAHNARERARSALRMAAE